MKSTKDPNWKEMAANKISLKTSLTKVINPEKPWPNDAPWCVDSWKPPLKKETLSKLLVYEATFSFTKSFRHMNGNHNTKGILRGTSWHGFSHVCVNCSIQTPSCPPRLSSPVWTALHNEHPRHSLNTCPCFTTQRKSSSFIEYIHEIGRGMSD